MAKGSTKKTWPFLPASMRSGVLSRFPGLGPVPRYSVITGMPQMAVAAVRLGKRRSFFMSDASRGPAEQGKTAISAWA